MVNPVAAAVRVSPFTVEGVIAPNVKASAPAVLIAETPLPVATELTNVPETPGNVITAVPAEVVPVILKLLVPGVPEDPAK